MDQEFEQKKKERVREREKEVGVDAPGVVSDGLKLEEPRWPCQVS